MGARITQLRREWNKVSSVKRRISYQIKRVRILQEDGSVERLIKILEAQAGKLFNGGCKFAVKVLAAGIPCEGLMKSVPARTVQPW